MTHKTKSLILIIPIFLLVIIFVFFAIKYYILINEYTHISTETPYINTENIQTEKYYIDNKDEKIKTIIHIK